jgi:glycine/D-amino acid oxidase-like deaminating enzyme
MAEVTIVGGGICGISTAYFLRKRGISSTILEKASCPINAASGRAGGFLARWMDGTPAESLTHASFALHHQLANNLGPDRIGFRILDGAVATGGSTTDGRAHSSAPRYVSNVSRSSTMARTNEVAVTHPARLCQAMLEESKADVITNASVSGVGRSDDSGADEPVVHSSCYTVDVNKALVLAMGPCCESARKRFPCELGSLPPIVGQKAHSITVKADVEPTAVFSSILDKSDGSTYEPEAYPRNGEVYVCGQHSNTPLPDSPDDIEPESDNMARLKHSAALLNETFADEGRITNESACYLPIATDGMPLLGEVPGTSSSSFIATGGSCWGILNGPAMGKVLEELIVDGKAQSANIDKLTPEGRTGGRKRRKSAVTV